MNHMKAFAIKNSCYNFFTYADNDAVGYFRKQGFTDKITLPRSKIHGNIKDYDGGTQMQCVLYDGVNYLNAPAMLARHRKVIADATKSRGVSGGVMPGLTVFAEGGTFMKIDQIKGVKEAGWKPPDAAGVQKLVLTEAQDKQLGNLLRGLLRDLRNSDHSWPFLEPVSQVEVPDYYTIIKEPMDLSLVARRIKEKHYKAKTEFITDINRIFDNW